MPISYKMSITNRLIAYTSSQHTNNVIRFYSNRTSQKHLSWNPSEVPASQQNIPAVYLLTMNNDVLRYIIRGQTGIWLNVLKQSWSNQRSTYIVVMWKWFLSVREICHTYLFANGHVFKFHPLYYKPASVLCGTTYHKCRYCICRSFARCSRVATFVRIYGQ